jgi:hypothetical protein
VSQEGRPSENPPDDPIQAEERKLWEEINQRLIDSVPKGTLVRDAPWEMSVALTIDPELVGLIRRLFQFADHGSGYIHDRLEERDPGDPEIGDLYGLPKWLEDGFH